MVEILKQNNIKITKQRISILKQLNDYKTMKDLLKENNDINYSTIYRIIQLFLEKEIIKIEIKNNEKNYIINNKEHVHYLNCIKCHKKEKLDFCPIQQINDFQIISHQLTIDGICKDCI